MRRGCIFRRILLFTSIKMMKLFAALLLLTSTVSGQRPFFAGFRPIGFPDTPNRTTTDSLTDRFGEGTTERLPIEANGDRDLIDRLSKLPLDQQPFWFINWQALEQHRKNPQTYPQRPNVFIDNSSQGAQSGLSNTNQGIPNNQGFSNNQGVPNNQRDLNPTKGISNSNNGSITTNTALSNSNNAFTNPSGGFSNSNTVAPNTVFVNRSPNSNQGLVTTTNSGFTNPNSGALNSSSNTNSNRGAVNTNARFSSSSAFSSSNNGVNNRFGTIPTTAKQNNYNYKWNNSYQHDYNYNSSFYVPNDSKQKYSSEEYY